MDKPEKSKKKNRKEIKQRKFTLLFFLLDFYSYIYCILIKISIPVTRSCRDLIGLRFLIVRIIIFFLFGLRFIFVRHRGDLIEL
jgi:hypothetical protein